MGRKFDVGNIYIASEITAIETAIEAQPIHKFNREVSKRNEIGLFVYVGCFVRYIVTL